MLWRVKKKVYHFCGSALSFHAASKVQQDFLNPVYCWFDSILKKQRVHLKMRFQSVNIQKKWLIRKDHWSAKKSCGFGSKTPEECDQGKHEKWRKMEWKSKLANVPSRSTCHSHKTERFWSALVQFMTWIWAPGCHMAGQTSSRSPVGV